MAIYKLMTGKSNTQDASEEGKYTFFDRSSVIKKSDKYIYDGKYTIIPGEGIFEPKYANGKFDLHQRAYAISSDYYIPKYLFYLIKKNKNIFYKYSVGSTVPSLRASSFEWINNIKIVSLEVQKQIIDIIEPVENLFLKYSNCVRIDTFENTKKDLKALIDIIEPVERLIFLTKSIIKIITKWYANKQIMEAKNKKIKDICLNSSNGFPYQKKHIDVKGIYKIFTIKNIKNSKNFSRTNFICNNKILVGDVVTGLSGTIGTTKIMDCDKWASNQRTLTINSKYFLEIKSIIEINMLKLLKIARGAAQKNISHFEILDLDISIKNYNHNISNTYLIMWRIVNLAKKIKKSLIELLIK